jgi:large subunit ribosomal protein L18
MADPTKQRLQTARKARSRGRIFGDLARPRLSVFVSNKAISAQIIDDAKGETLASARILVEKVSKTDTATEVGKQIAANAKKAKVTKVVFDRNGKKYHGRIKALAEAAREAGLEF